jgi:hypothetical protein
LKIIIILAILLNISFAIGPCPKNEKVCLYLYKGPMLREIRITNLENKTIIFNAGGYLSSELFLVEHVRLKAYQTYTAIQKFYLYPHDIQNDNKNMVRFEYIFDNNKEYINLYKNKYTITGRKKHKIKITRKVFDRRVR